MAEQTADAGNEGGTAVLDEGTDGGGVGQQQTAEAKPASKDSYQQLQGDLEDFETVNNDGTPLEDKEPTDEAADKQPTKLDKPQTAANGEKTETDAQADSFLKGYFVKGDDGAFSFDVSKFAGDVIGKEQFKYGERQFAEEVAPDGKAKPEVDPDEDYFRQEKGYRSTLRENFLLYPAALDKALAQLGVQVTPELRQAHELAVRQIEAKLQGHFEERDIKRQAESRKSMRGEAEAVHREQASRAKAEANLSRVVSEVGGSEKWQALCMNGLDHINMLFDLANPEFKGSKEATSKAIQKWFTESVAGNEKSLRMFARIMKGEAALRAIPWTFKQGMQAKGKTDSQNRTTHSRQVGGRTGGAPKAASGQRDTIDSWLNPTGEREVRDSV